MQNIKICILNHLPCDIYNVITYRKFSPAYW